MSCLISAEDVSTAIPLVPIAVGLSFCSLMAPRFNNPSTLCHGIVASAYAFPRRGLMSSVAAPAPPVLRNRDAARLYRNLASHDGRSTYEHLASRD